MLSDLFVHVRAAVPRGDRGVSKASEWAESIDLDPRDDAAVVYTAAGAVAAVFSWPGHEPRLSFVERDGYSHPTFRAAEALALARWILDVFGEEGS